MKFVTKSWVQTQFNSFAARISAVFAKKSDVPTKTSQLQNDSGYKTTDTTYGDATQSAHGLMTAADKKKLDGVAEGANKTTYTNNLTATVPGTALDATQGKILNDKGAQMSVYKGDDGNLHFRDWAGADTVIPFSFNSPNINSETFTGNSKTFILEEKPVFFAAARADSSTYAAFLINAENGVAQKAGYGLIITKINDKEYTVANSVSQSKTIICYWM